MREEALKVYVQETSVLSITISSGQQLVIKVIQKMVGY